VVLGLLLKEIVMPYGNTDYFPSLKTFSSWFSNGNNARHKKMMRRKNNEREK